MGSCRSPLYHVFSKSGKLPGNQISFSLLVSGCSILKNTWGEKVCRRGKNSVVTCAALLCPCFCESILYNPVSLCPDFLFIKKVLRGSIESLYFLDVFCDIKGIKWKLLSLPFSVLLHKSFPQKSFTLKNCVTYPPG